MDIKNVTKENIGRRVKGIEYGHPVTGTIIDIVEIHSPNDGKICSVGFLIKMDEPMHYIEEYWTGATILTKEWENDTYESTGRIFDGWGNIQNTEFID